MKKLIRFDAATTSRYTRAADYAPRPAWMGPLTDSRACTRGKPQGSIRIRTVLLLAALVASSVVAGYLILEQLQRLSNDVEQERGTQQQHERDADYGVEQRRRSYSADNSGGSDALRHAAFEAFSDRGESDERREDQDHHGEPAACGVVAVVVLIPEIGECGATGPEPSRGTNDSSEQVLLRRDVHQSPFQRRAAWNGSAIPNA